MINPAAHGWVSQMQKFFNRSTDCLVEADSNFAPKPDMFTVAQQVAHVAQTVDWFIDGAFTAKGFDTDFAALEQRVRQVKSLAEARRRLDAAFDRLKQIAAEIPPDRIHIDTIPPDNFMPPMTKAAAMNSVEDHTAHHRGALAVYSRLLGKTPAMPYM